MKLTHKVYHLCGESGKPLNKNDVLFLVVNDQMTKIPISALFKGFEQYSDRISGWSILQAFDIITEGEHAYELKYQDIRIFFANPRMGESIGVMRRSNPTVEMEDKVISEDEKVSYINMIRDLAGKSKIQIKQKENTKETKDESIIEVENKKPEVEDKNLKGEGKNELLELERKAEENNNSEADEDSQIEEPEEYKKIESDYIKDNYNVHKLGKYRLFKKFGSAYTIYKLDDNEFGKVKIIDVNDNIIDVLDNGEEVTLTFDFQLENENQQ